MAVLEKDIAAFERMKATLQSNHPRAWVVFHEGRFEGAFEDFEAAAAAAVDRFDTGPYLIRQLGAGPVQLPGGMVFTPAHARGPGRLLAAVAGPKPPPICWSVSARSEGRCRSEIPGPYRRGTSEPAGEGDQGAHRHGRRRRLHRRVCPILGLPVMDEGEISGVGGRHDAKVYLARIHIPSMDKLLFQRFTGVKLSEGGKWHKVILGRTFLRHCRLTYGGADGRVQIEAA